MSNFAAGEAFTQKIKYANKMYRFIKTKKEREKEKQELYEKISGSLSIIETLLKLNLEDEYPLL
jgi:hypothetical protein